MLFQSSKQEKNCCLIIQQWNENKGKKIIRAFLLGGIHSNILISRPFFFVHFPSDIFNEMLWMKAWYWEGWWGLVVWLFFCCLFSFCVDLLVALFGFSVVCCFSETEARGDTSFKRTNSFIQHYDRTKICSLHHSLLSLHKIIQEKSMYL